MRQRIPIVLRQHDFALLWVALLVMAVATQMAAVAIGWQVYAIDRRPLDLGLIGLAEFLPLPLLALPAGQLADRLPRRSIQLRRIASGVAVGSGGGGEPSGSRLSRLTRLRRT